MACAALAAACLSGCGDGAATAGATPTLSASADPIPRFQAAYSQCRDNGATLTAADRLTTLIIDTRSKYGSYEALECVLDHLGTSRAIRAQMNSTTAMMGVQDAEEDGLTYKWSYHPDNGVNMVITDGG
jgi:hypothetical protein